MIREAIENYTRLLYTTGGVRVMAMDLDGEGYRLLEDELKSLYGIAVELPVVRERIEPHIRLMTAYGQVEIRKVEA